MQDVDISKVVTADTIMKNPGEVASFAHDGPKAALWKMRQAGLSSIYVQHKNRLVGLVRAEDASSALKAGDKDLRNILVTDIHGCRRTRRPTSSSLSWRRAAPSPWWITKTISWASSSRARSWRPLQKEYRPMDWLNNIPRIPIGDAIDYAITLFSDNFSFLTKAFSDVVESGIAILIQGLMFFPPWVLILAFTALAWFLSRKRSVMLLTLIGLFLIWNMKLWAPW